MNGPARRKRRVGFDGNPPVPRTWEDFGVRRRIDALELALSQMVECFDRASATLPPSAALMMQGAFGKAPEVAGKILKKAP